MSAASRCARCVRPLNPGGPAYVLAGMRYLKRIVFMVAAVAGLVAVAAGPAAAGTSFNHALPDERG